MDCSLPGCFVHGIFQARILEWPFPSPGDLPNPGIKTVSLVSPALAGRFFTTVSPVIINITFITFPVKRFLLCASSYKNPCPCIPNPKCACTFTHVQLFVTPCTLDSLFHVIFQARITGVGCHFLLQGLPSSGIKPMSLVSPALLVGLFTTEPPGEPICIDT